MDESAIPYKFAYVWGEAASSGYITATIPTTASGAAASQQQGFPQITAANPGAGGIPPSIADFNGAFNYFSAWAQWVQAGGPVGYDSAFSTAIGGYPVGAIIAASVGNGKAWRSTVDNNTSDPDTGGANWVNAFGGRLLNIQRFTTAGTATYTSTIGTQSVVFGVQGGGGGSAGVGAAGTGNAIAGEPGNGGAYGEARVTSGFSGITITVGAGGAAGVPNVSNGGSGGASSAGAFVNSPGGPGGQQGNVDAGSASGGNGLTSGLPTFSGGAQIIKACQGGVGSISLGFTTGSVSYGGSGGNAGDGGGGAQGVSANFNGIAAESPGSGASGTMGINNSGVLNGALGADGYVLVFEFS